MQFLLWAIHGAKMATPLDSNLIPTFRGHMDLHNPAREKSVIYFDIGHIPCHIWPILKFLGQDIHGLAPGAYMAAPWGPKLISTFRGHMDL